MRKKNIVSIALAFLLLGSTLTVRPASDIHDIGTARTKEKKTEVNLSANSTTQLKKKNKNKETNVSINAKVLLEPTGSYPEAAIAAKGANDFAFRLSAALASQTGDNNLVCSPYSVWMPLAALVNATDVQNKTALLESLGAAGISETDINNAASRMLYGLTRQSDKKYYGEAYRNPLQIANAIFVADRVTLNKDFAQIFADYYRGNAMTVDFNSPETVNLVNQWASDNTEGLITEIVQEFTPNTVAAIANAIYFSDRWEWEFNPNETIENVFHSPTGDMTAFYMLREGDGQLYYEDDKIQAMSLSFLTSGGGMYIMLPRDGDAEGLLSSMTSEYFEEIKGKRIFATGKLLLPRFSIESDVMQLGDTLTALGVPLFDETTAPLDRLTKEKTHLYVASAVQKAVIEVDEKGTTAAAVTMLDLDDSAAEFEPTKPFKMICDKPFVFVLYGYTYDGGTQILFTGIVNKP